MDWNPHFTHKQAMQAGGEIQPLRTLTVAVLEDLEAVKHNLYSMISQYEPWTRGGPTIKQPGSRFELTLRVTERTDLTDGKFLQCKPALKGTGTVPKYTPFQCDLSKKTVSGLFSVLIGRRESYHLDFPFSWLVLFSSS